MIQEFKSASNECCVELNKFSRNYIYTGTLHAEQLSAQHQKRIKSHTLSYSGIMIYVRMYVFDIHSAKTDLWLYINVWSSNNGHVRDPL